LLIAGKLIDFGGATDKSDQDSVWTAVREFAEETAGLFFIPPKHDPNFPEFFEFVKTVQSFTESDMQKDSNVKKLIDLGYEDIMAGKTEMYKVLTRGKVPWPSDWLYVLYLPRINWKSLEHVNDAWKDSPKKRREFDWLPADDLVSILTSKRKCDGTKAELLARVADAKNLVETVQKIVDKHKKKPKSAIKPGAWDL